VIKAAPYGAAGPASAAGSALGRPPAARRATRARHRSRRLIRHADRFSAHSPLPGPDRPVREPPQQGRPCAVASGRRTVPRQRMRVREYQLPIPKAPPATVSGGTWCQTSRMIPPSRKATGCRRSIDRRMSPKGRRARRGALVPTTTPCPASWRIYGTWRAISSGTLRPRTTPSDASAWQTGSSESCTAKAED